MTQMDQPMEWDCLDPYYVWCETTGFAGFPSADGDFVPVLVETPEHWAAKDWLAELQDAYRNELYIPRPNPDIRGFTIHVRKPSLARILAALAQAGARWELGLPFASPTYLMALDAGRFRSESGQHVVGFIDYGCAFAHSQFRAWNAGRPTSSTRVLALWDQGGNPARNRMAAVKAGLRPPCWIGPGDFGYGAELLRDTCSQSLWDKIEISPGHSETIRGLSMNDYLQEFILHGEIDEERCYDYSGYQPVCAPITHGVHIMDVAAGYPNPWLGPDADPGPPPGQEIVFVQLPRFFSGQQVSGLLRTYVLDAVNYIISCAAPTVPVTINLSYGANAGPHDGSSILELTLDEIIAARRAGGGPTDIVIAAGNNADSETHAAGNLGPREARRWIWCNIPDNPTDQLTEVWIDGEDADQPCQIRLTPPGEDPSRQPWVSISQVHTCKRDGQVMAMIIAPKRVCQGRDGRMALFAVGPTATGPKRIAAPYGDWMLDVFNPGSGDVGINAWTERDEPVFMSGSGPRQARFRSSDATGWGSLNSLAHGRETIVVGGYVAGSGRVPDYSGRGPDTGRPAGRNGGRGSAAAPMPAHFWLAPCEESDALPGLAAAAVIGTERVRLPGTSVAAAYATRYLVGKRTAEVAARSANAAPRGHPERTSESPFRVPYP